MHLWHAVEDHYAEGVLGDAVRSALAGSGSIVRSLAVRHRPRSGAPEELREDQGISSRAIIEGITICSAAPRPSVPAKHSSGRLL